MALKNVKVRVCDHCDCEIAKSIATPLAFSHSPNDASVKVIRTKSDGEPIGGYIDLFDTETGEFCSINCFMSYVRERLCSFIPKKK